MRIPALLFSVLLSVLTLLAPAHAVQPPTMRLDYYHTGNATTETFSFDRVVIEPLPWPGDMSKTVDDTNLGNYFFEVRDVAGGKLLYSRGFGSIFSEWSDTDEAKKLNRTFSESLRFPAPSAPVKIVLKERREGKDLEFHEVWTTTIDPKVKFIVRAKPASPGPAADSAENGRTAKQGRSVDPGGWIHCCRAWQVPKRRQARDGNLVFALAV